MDKSKKLVFKNFNYFHHKIKDFYLFNKNIRKLLKKQEVTNDGIDEEDTPLVLEFQRAHIDDKERIAVPELLFYKIANVLATKTTLTRKKAETAFGFLFEFELETYSLGWEEFIL